MVHARLKDTHLTEMMVVMVEDVRVAKKLFYILIYFLLFVFVCLYLFVSLFFKTSKPLKNFSFHIPFI